MQSGYRRATPVRVPIAFERFLPKQTVLAGDGNLFGILVQQRFQSFAHALNCRNITAPRRRVDGHFPMPIRSRGRNGGPGGGASVLASRVFQIVGLTGRSALPFLVYGRAVLLRCQFVSAATAGRL